jgi:hypothetical protein
MMMNNKRMRLHYVIMTGLTRTPKPIVITDSMDAKNAAKDLPRASM